MDAVLKCIGLSVTEHGKSIVKNASLSLYKGEIHIIIGENEAGKSTLMKCLAGLRGYNDGEIWIDGKRQESYSLFTAQKNGVFMILHNSALLPNLTVAENIFIKRWQKKASGQIDWKAQREKARQLIKEFNVPIDENMQVGKLGMAEQRIVEIIKAICFDAKVLIFDESFSQLTNSEIDKVYQTLENLKDRGTSIVLVTQKHQKRMERADRISIMAEGSIKRTVDKEEVPVVLKETLVNHVMYYPHIRRPGPDIMLETKDLAGEFALNGVSFQAKKGEILGITGMMGSGRTCLANLITGVMQPIRGEILFCGKPVRFKSPKDARAAGIVYLPEDNAASLVPEFQVEKNITLGNLKRVSNSGLINLRYEKLVGKEYGKRLGINHWSNVKKSCELSYGAMQKVLWAKNIMAHARLFIMDEPTKGLDSASRVDAYNIINTLALERKTIIMISSNFEELIAMCDRVLILRDGRIAKELSEKHITVENIVKYSYEE